MHGLTVMRFLTVSGFVHLPIATFSSITTMVTSTMPGLTGRRPFAPPSLLDNLI